MTYFVVEAGKHQGGPLGGLQFDLQVGPSPQQLPDDLHMPTLRGGHQRGQGRGQHLLPHQLGRVHLATRTCQQQHSKEKANKLTIR